MEKYFEIKNVCCIYGIYIYINGIIEDNNNNNNNNFGIEEYHQLQIQQNKVIKGVIMELNKS